MARAAVCGPLGEKQCILQSQVGSSDECSLSSDSNAPTRLREKEQVTPSGFLSKARMQEKEQRGLYIRTFEDAHSIVPQTQRMPEIIGGGGCTGQPSDLPTTSELCS